MLISLCFLFTMSAVCDIRGYKQGRQNMVVHQLIEAEWRIYASLNWVILGSDNGLSPVRRQAIIWTNSGILLIWHLGTNFNEMLIEIQTFPFKKIRLKMSSGKCRPFCLGLNVLNDVIRLQTCLVPKWNDSHVNWTHMAPNVVMYKTTRVGRDAL